MKNKLLFTLLLAISFNLIAAKADFTVCKSPFALCTTAPCESIPGKKGYVSCHCKVKKGYSAGKKSCSALKKATQGQALSSRYSPIKSYVICKNDRPWAWCLDSPCVIDKKHPRKATCLCSVVKNKGAYILVTKKAKKTTCSKGLYSSATLNGANALTDYLKGSKELPPFPAKVLSPK